MAGQRTCLARDALHHVAVRGDDVDMVVEWALTRRRLWVQEPSLRRAAMAIPTAAPRPCPSGPVVISTPGCGGTPGARASLSPMCAMPPGPLSPADTRTGTAGCRGSGWCARPTARTGPGQATGHRQDHGPLRSGTADMPAVPGSSPSRDGHCPPSGRRPRRATGRCPPRARRQLATRAAPPAAAPKTDPGAASLPCGARVSTVLGMLLVHDKPHSLEWLAEPFGPQQPRWPMTPHRQASCRSVGIRRNSLAVAEWAASIPTRSGRSNHQPQSRSGADHGSACTSKATGG